MPELGKATYTLVFDDAAFEKGLGRAESNVDTLTTRISQRLGIAEKEIGAMGASAEEMGTAVAQAGDEAAAGFGRAATGAEEAATAAEGAAGATTAAGAATAAAGRAGATGWGRLGASIKRTGESASKWAGLAGLGALYFTIKGGVTWLKESNEGMQLVKGSIMSTGAAAGVTANYAGKLADRMTGISGASRGAGLQIQQLLLRFTNIRRLGPGVADIYTRAFMQVNNIAAATHRNATMISLALGRVLQDPIKNLGSLGRAGVTFTNAQKAMVVQLFKTKGAMAAQEYILGILDKRYGGAAKRLGDSFNGQMHKAKDAIEKASAKMLLAFLPAFMKVLRVMTRFATWIEKNRKLVQNLIVVFVALKGVMIAVGFAEKLMARGLLTNVFAAAIVALVILYTRSARFRAIVQSIVAWMKRWRAVLIALGGALVVLVVAIKLARALRLAAYGIRGGFLAARSGVIAFGAAGLIAVAALVAAVGGLIYMVYKLKQAWDEADAAGARADARANTAWGRKAWAYDALVHKYEAGGMSPAQAEAAAKAQIKKRYGKDAMGPNDKDKAAYAAKFKAKKPKMPKMPKMPKVGAPGYAAPLSQGDFSQPTVPGAGSTAAALGGDRWTKLQNAYLAAQHTKGKADDAKALHNEESYLSGLLRQRGISAKKRHAILSALHGVDSRLASLSKKAGAGHGKSAADAQFSAFNDRIDLIEAKIATEKHKRARDRLLKQEMRMLNNEESYLQKKLKAKHLSLKEQGKIAREIKEIERKKLELAKKQKAATDQFGKQYEAVLETRGSFFADFAGNIFGQSSGGLTVGGTHGDHEVNVNQTNHYNEIPKNRYAHARAMHRAASEAMGGV